MCHWILKPLFSGYCSVWNHCITKVWTRCCGTKTQYLTQCLAKGIVTSKCQNLLIRHCVFISRPWILVITSAIDTEIWRSDEAAAMGWQRRALSPSDICHVYTNGTRITMTTRQSPLHTWITAILGSETSMGCHGYMSSLCGAAAACGVVGGPMRVLHTGRLLCCAQATGAIRLIIPKLHSAGPNLDMPNFLFPLRKIYN